MRHWQLAIVVCFVWALCTRELIADPKADAAARKRLTEVQRIIKSVPRLAPEKRAEVLARLKELKEDGAPVVEVSVELAAGTNPQTQLLGLELIREFLPERVATVERLMKRPGNGLETHKVFVEWTKAADALLKDDRGSEVLFPLVAANLNYAWVATSDPQILNRTSNPDWQYATRSMRAFAIKIANRHPPAARAVLQLATATVTYAPGTFPPGLDERFRLRNDTISSLAAFRDSDPAIRQQAIAALQLMLRNTDDCAGTQQTPASVAALTLARFDGKPSGK